MGLDTRVEMIWKSLMLKEGAVIINKFYYWFHNDLIVFENESASL
jgi:hypothetical protein